VNGAAEISVDSDLLAIFDTDGKRPRSVLLVRITEAYLHCGKALIRSSCGVTTTKSIAADCRRMAAC
jgi:predicted pyridoxine 5'-phosphate oxidase superfamily flavin-nucleotide-binding protein